MFSEKRGREKVEDDDLFLGLSAVDRQQDNENKIQEKLKLDLKLKEYERIEYLKQKE